MIKLDDQYCVEVRGYKGKYTVQVVYSDQEQGVTWQSPEMFEEKPSEQTLKTIGDAYVKGVYSGIMQGRTGVKKKLRELLGIEHRL